MEKQVVLITGTSRGIGRLLLEDLRKNTSLVMYGSSRIKKPSKPRFHFKMGSMSKPLTLLSRIMPESLFQNMVLRTLGIPGSIHY